VDGGVSIPAAPETAAISQSPESGGGPADKLAFAWGAVLAGILVAAVIVGLAAVKRGLDLSDESYYVFASQHARSYLRSSTEFPLVVSPVLSLVGSAWMLRVVKLLALVAAHAFFAWCFVKTAPSLVGASFKRSDRIAVGAAIVAGALSVARFLPQSPSYNDITVGIVVTVSGLLLVLADKRVSGRVEIATWFAVGALVWFQLLVKWPSTTSLVPLAAITFFWTSPQWKRLARNAGVVLAGLAAGALVTQIFLAPVSDILDSIKQGNADASNTLGHNESDLLSQYRRNLGDLLHVMTHHFWYLLAAAVAVGLLLRFRRLARPVALVAAAGLLALTPLFVASGRARGGVEPLELVLAKSVILPLYVVLAILAAVAALVVRAGTRPGLRGFFILGALLVAPFLTALGTNNPIWFNASFASAFWVAAALAILSLTHRRHSRVLVHALAFAFVALLAFSAYDGTWRRPYRQSPLAQDTVQVHIGGPLRGLRLDPLTAQFVAQVRATTDAIPGAKRPFMIVWNPGVPGASLAGGLEQPLYAWLSRPTFAVNSLVAACQDHTRGILLLQYPSQPANIRANPYLSAACTGRTWTQQAPISVLAAWYAPPTA
jgi:hypothetical protein